MAFHEGKACDAVIRVLEAREGESRRDLRSPEKDGDPAPIELTCRIGDRLFAFEHTGIEPFAGHVKFEAEAQAHLDPIRDHARRQLPPERRLRASYVGYGDAGKTQARTRTDTDRPCRMDRTTAPTIKAAPVRLLPQIRSKSYAARGAVRGFLVSLSAGRSRARLLQIKHQVSGNLEEAREDRLREACTRKFPKLEAWRQKSGARTVLTLEDNDIHLTNPQRVFDVLAQVEDTIAGKPDEIHLVGTFIDNPWYVHALRIDNQYLLPAQRISAVHDRDRFQRSC